MDKTSSFRERAKADGSGLLQQVSHHHNGHGPHGLLKKKKKKCIVNRDMMIGWEPRDEECKALKSVRDQKGRSQMRASRFGETVDQSPLPYSLENNKIC